MLPRKNGTTAFSTYARSKWLGMVARNFAKAAERSGAAGAADAEVESAATAAAPPKRSVRLSRSVMRAPVHCRMDCCQPAGHCPVFGTAGGARLPIGAQYRPLSR